MKILIINYEFPPVGGGGGTASYYLSSELVRLGYEVDVLTSRFKNLKEKETINGVTVYRVPVLRKRRDYCTFIEMLTFIISSFFFLCRLLKNKKYDLVQAFFSFPSGILGIISKKLFGIPYILSLRGGDVPGANPYRYKTLHMILFPIQCQVWKSANAITALPGVVKQVSKLDPNLNFQVIPNGVDIKKFKPLSEKRTDIINILYVGRLIRRKGLKYLIQSMPTVISKTRIMLKLTIIGDGPIREKLETMVKKLIVEHVIDFQGFVSEKKLVERYQKADIFVLPSLFEGFGNVITEAMASGLPVIATRVGAIPEIVIDGETGFLVQSKDSVSLADAITKLVVDKNLRKKMGKAGRTRVEKLYSWSKIVEKYVATYLRCLSRAKVF